MLKCNAAEGQWQVIAIGVRPGDLTGAGCFFYRPPLSYEPISGNDAQVKYSRIQVKQVLYSFSHLFIPSESQEKEK